jgi:carbamoyltransferase
MDGVGEWTTTSLALGNDAGLKVVREIHFPHSLGLLYSAFTYYTGFKVNSGEYKVMGLAPYGEPRYAQRIREHLIDVKDDGSFRLNLDYFDYCTGLRMTNARFDELFGGPARRPESPLTQRDMDLAASVQVVTEEILLKLARSLATESGEHNLCLAGGVALNCVANGKLLRQGAFDRLWLQPAAGDAGGAVGAALVAAHLYKGLPRRAEPGRDAMQGATSARTTRRATSNTGLRRPGHASRRSRTMHSSRSAPLPWRRDGRSAGIRGGWSSGRGRLAAAPFSATRARRTCRRR